jgi:hypothetical protein
METKKSNYGNTQIKTELYRNIDFDITIPKLKIKINYPHIHPDVRFPEILDHNYVTYFNKT